MATPASAATAACSASPVAASTRYPVTNPTKAQIACALRSCFFIPRVSAVLARSLRYAHAVAQGHRDTARLRVGCVLPDLRGYVLRASRRAGLVADSLPQSFVVGDRLR